MRQKLKTVAIHKKQISLLILFVLILFTLYALKHELNRVNESQAATKIVTLKTANIVGLNATTKNKFDTLSKQSTSKKSQLLEVSNVNDIVKADSVVVPLLEKGNVTLNKTQIKNISGGVKIWKSIITVKGFKRISYFSIKDGKLTGEIDLGDKRKYSLTSIDATRLSLNEHDFTKQTKTGEYVQNQSTNGNGMQAVPPVSYAPYSPKNISIMFVYTEVLNNPLSTIYIELEKLNDAADNSAIVHNFTYCTSKYVKGYEHVDPFEALNRFQFVGGVNSAYDEIQTIRSKNNCDIAVLIHSIKGNGFWGAANFYPGRGAGSANKAYAVVDYRHLADNILQHEVGHIFGATHAIDDPTPDNYYFEFGHAKRLPSLGVHTVLAYNTNAACPMNYCAPILYFSTPLKSFSGQSLGSENLENNARVININGVGVSDYGVLFSGGGGSGGGCAGSGTKTCGQTCNTDCDCDPNSNYECKDVGTGGKVCWNESMCGGPALKARIEGYVYGCNGQKLANVPVKAWGNTVNTDSTGKFTLNKGVDVKNIELMETSILAGADATKNTAHGYYTDDYSQLSLKGAGTPQLACANVNCLFNAKVGDGIPIDNGNKLHASGPARYAYRIQKPMTDAFFEYNFVFKDINAKSFDFRQANCAVSAPTPTPVPAKYVQEYIVRNNIVWARDNNNPNNSWDTSWTNTNTNFTNVGTGAITSFAAFVHPQGYIQQHLVRNGIVWARDNNNAGGAWDSSWTNSNTSFNGVGSGTITSFASFIHTQGYIQQYLVRNGIVWARDNNNAGGAWDTSWTNANINFNGVGSGVIASFSAYVHPQGYIQQHLVRNGVVWTRDNNNAGGAWDTGWGNATSTFTGVGSGTINSFTANTRNK